MTTSASKASAIGAARMPTHGSWRPKVSTVAAWPARSMERRGVRIELVGLMAMPTVRSCPVEMPPSTPPALLPTKPSGVSSSPCVLPRCAMQAKPAPISTPLTALRPIMAEGDGGIELVVERVAQPDRYAAADHVDAGAASCRRPCAAHPCRPRGAGCRWRWRRRRGWHRRAPSPRRESRSRRSASGGRRRSRHGRGAAICGRWHRAATVGAVSRADARPAARADRAGRTCADRCSRHGRAERCRAGSRSPCCAGRCCGSGGRSACPVVRPSKTPERISTRSASWRCVTCREVPGAAPVEVGLDVGIRELEAGRTAVDDAADRGAVALAEVGDPKERA